MTETRYYVTTLPVLLGTSRITPFIPMRGAAVKNQRQTLSVAQFSSQKAKTPDISNLSYEPEGIL